MSQAVPAAVTSCRFPVTVIKFLICIETWHEGPSSILNILQDAIVFLAVGGWGFCLFFS